MGTFHFIIVEAPKAYHNETEVGGVSLVTNTNIESVEHMNRIATVIDAPEGTILEPGDQIICHHNIFRHKRDPKGERIKSEYFIDHGRYWVPPDMVFAYKREGMRDWEALSPYLFVQPIERELEKTKSGIFLESGGTKHVEHQGMVFFSNKVLREEWDVWEGDIVGFGANQEYKFEIDGEELYRVRMPKLLYKVCLD